MEKNGMNCTASRNNLQLAFDIRRGQWLLYNAEALLPAALSFLNRLPVTLDMPEFNVSAYAENSDGTLCGSEPDNDTKIVTVIPIIGTITKYDSCGTVGAISIAEAISDAASNNNSIGVVLDIDSGGGSTNAIPFVVEAIRKVQAAGKPIVAHCDLCASAAYWIASQCDAVFADNDLSVFGSIGVMAQFVDDSNTPDGNHIITIYAKESPDKNLSYRKALQGDYELAQEELSPFVTAFHEAVKKSRRRLQADADGVLTGGTFLSHQAIDVGLVDDILTLENTIQNVFIRAHYN
ncbi:S49 family peptidase [Muribaculum intestinale]|uniref:S49 family peptidase n=1 Tax=Muribaculum intestinale TaxID=1796646 RepID=UPI00259CFD61|nr:S49 family peptidase [Muribaculum intestinale]